MLRLESLEGRALLHGGGIEIFPDYIVAPGGSATAVDIIPRFAANPTIWSTASGDWDNPLTWSAGRVPNSTDRVVVAPDDTVVLGAGHDAGAAADSLEIQERGALVFSAEVNTRLTVANVLVLPEGLLQIGTDNLPIASNKRAELIIRSKPLDVGYVDATGVHAGSDPRQFGDGLIVYGKLEMHGASRGQTWVELAAPALQSDSSIWLTQTVGWQVGDRIVLPDTRQVQTGSPQPGPGVAGQWEEADIVSIEGNRINLAEPLAYDHRGANTTLVAQSELMPHAALLTRNVVIASEDAALLPGGTRGHALFGNQAEIDVEYAQFKNLGRTDALAAGPDPYTAQALDNSTFDANGQLTHIGTNQIGRYAVHMHHLIGAENPTNTGYQFTFVGNTIQGSKKWSLTLHGTSFGLISNNVIYDGQGAGIVTEDGSEIGNEITNNMVIAIRGTGVDGNQGIFDRSVPGAPPDDFGRGGVGIWFRRSGNIVSGNVVADATFAGYVFNSYFLLGEVLVPTVRGQSKLEDGDGVRLRNNDPGVFAQNEVYGMGNYGLWVSYPTGKNVDPTGNPNTLPWMEIVDFRAWHASTSAGVLMYHVSNVRLENPIIVSDLAAWRRNDTGPAGIYLGHDYEAYNIQLIGAIVEGHRLGLVAPRADYSRFNADTGEWINPTLVEDGTFKNYFNFLVQPQLQYTTAAGNVLELRNVALDSPGFQGVGVPLNASREPSGPLNIEMNLVAADANVTHHSLVRVFNYDRNPGDNFEVLYNEQLPGAIVPQTDPKALVSAGSRIGTIGAPVANLTNDEAWAQYGIAVGGRPAAGMRVSQPEIVGVLVPMDADTPATPHRIALLTPWDGAVLVGASAVRVRYNINHGLPTGYDVWMQLDGAPPVNARDFGGVFWQVPNGLHTLTAWITDEVGSQVTAETASFAMVSYESPATRYVTSGKDSGPGSLRQAILDVNSSGGAVNTIILMAAGEIMMTAPLPDLQYPVTLNVPINVNVRIGMLGPLYPFPKFVSLTKSGDGILDLRGVVATGEPVSLVVEQGTLNLWYAGGPALDVAVGGLGAPAHLQFEENATLRSLSVQAGGVASLAAGVSRQVIDVSALAVETGAALDLNYGQMIVRGTAQTAVESYNAVAALIALAANGPNGQQWLGTGITSTAAAFDATRLTALGVLLNDNGLGGAWWSSFAGVQVGRFDTLVRWTYVGDADLSGDVNGNDYALIDNGFNSGGQGWANGDFNYSGIVDGTDYALIDNAFNSQIGPIARRFRRNSW